MISLPPPVLPAPLQTNKFVIQRRLRSIGENGRWSSSEKRKQKLTSVPIRMGSREPNQGKYNESALVSNQNPPEIPDMRSASAAVVDDITDHHLYPTLPPDPVSAPKRKKAGAGIVVF